MRALCYAGYLPGVRKNHPEIKEEVTQNVVVKQGGEAGAKKPAPRGSTLEGVFAASAVVIEAANQLCLPRATEEAEIDRTLLRTEEQERGKCEENQISQPSSKPR